MRETGFPSSQISMPPAMACAWKSMSAGLDGHHSAAAGGGFGPSLIPEDVHPETVATASKQENKRRFMAGA
jgi:hypothetical protein